MSILPWLLDQLQRGYNYLIGLTDQVVANIIAAGIVALLGPGLGVADSARVQAEAQGDRGRNLP